MKGEKSPGSPAEVPVFEPLGIRLMLSGDTPALLSPGIHPSEGEQLATGDEATKVDQDPTPEADLLAMAASTSSTGETVADSAAGPAENPAGGAAIGAADSILPANLQAMAYEANQPMGVARGIYPGRVTWVHDPDATSWDGSTGHWWDDNNTDQAVVEDMMSKAIRWQTGEGTDAAAWDALFRDFNQTHSGQDIGYSPGDKIAIKVNLNTVNSYADQDNQVDASPHVVLALLRQLVNRAGVDEAEITVYDASREVPDRLYDPCHAEFPDVRFMDRRGYYGRIKAQADTSAVVHYGDAPDSVDTYLPTVVTEAKYSINVANLKKHVHAGVTLTGKNLFGCVQKLGGGWWPELLHPYVDTNLPMGSYNALVDLMGHEQLGGKTLLYMIDGLYGAMTQSTDPVRWDTFGDDWTSSLFVSQDPVAIDSVGLDFLRAESTLQGNPDNYLHEAATAEQAKPWGSYDPEGDGSSLESLGVHEHWDNATDKQYTRNLGTGDGIELISSDPGSNQAPVAADDDYSVDEDDTLSVPAPGVLANDSDGDEDTLSAVLVSDAGHGSLTLNPDGSFTYEPDADYNGPDSFTYQAYDGQAYSNEATVTLTVNPAADVTRRHVFYNRSAFDGDDPAANAQDDGAIATDKQALLPGQTATFANCTSYSRGINGIIVDIDGLGNPAALGATDFEFRVGNDDDPGSWAVAAPPQEITVREDAGIGGSDRVMMTWVDNAIEKQWLQVTALATPNTDLPSEDVFYFGNAIGESGDSATDAEVNATDEVGARNNPHYFGDPAAVDDAYDYNRDARVNATDEILARDNQTFFDTALQLITVPPAGAMGMSGPAGGFVSEALGNTPTIVVGDHVLLPDTPGQTIAIYVSGGDAVQGLNFNIQTGGGGPAVANVDILNGTIFDGNNNGTIDLDGPHPDGWPLWEGRSTTTGSGTASADGLLATVTIDTTGLTSGTWDLRMTNTLNGPTDFAGVGAAITDGSIALNRAPVANDDTAGTAEDTPINVDVLANDTDAESDPLTISILSASNGTAVVNDGGTPSDPMDDTVDFTPDANFNGTAGFTYRVNDGLLDSNVATVTVTVDPVNDQPVLVTPVSDVTVAEDAADTVLDLSAVFDDVDIPTNGDSLTLSVAGNTNPSLVSANLNGTQLTLWYAADQNGTSAITIRATDLGSLFIEDTFTLTVDPVNDAPVANDDAGQTAEDTPANVDVLANDSDVENDPLTISILSATNGTAVVNDGGTPSDPTDDTVDFTPGADFHGTASFTYQVNDGLLDSNTATATITVDPVADVTGRYIFYNNSAFDGNDAGANAQDDGAIASDKQALLPGQTGTFANYTSYGQGINGIIVDIDDLGNPAVLSAADFQFRVGNDDDPDGWPAAPAPQSVTVREDAGVGGSDRVTIIWSDNDWSTPTPGPEAIAGQWLQATVLATDNTGLTQPDIFCLGNAIGESGNSATEALVNATDQVDARNHPHYFADPAAIDDAYDYNRDARVNATDEIIARNNQTYFATKLELITVPPAGSAEMVAPAGGSVGAALGNTPTIVVGDHLLLPNMPGQIIAINVSSGDAVQGLNFNVQVGDGGPAITDADILDGTIFDGNNTGTSDLDGAHPDAWPLWEGRSTTTASGTVAAAGLLATVTIDTTGLTSGTWDLRMSNTLNGPTDFAGIAADITEGSIALADAPVAVDDAASTAEDTPVNVDVLANDIESGSGPLTIELVAASNGTAAVNDGGTPSDPTDDTVDFTPDADFGGTASFTYRVDDGLVSSNVATVTITVSPVNDAPQADAGGDQDVVDGDGDGYQTVSLDGSGSSDVEGIASYSWGENSIEIANSAASAVDVHLPIGRHWITLMVTDGEGAIDTDQVVVTVAPVPAVGGPLTLANPVETGIHQRGYDYRLMFSGGGDATATLWSFSPAGWRVIADSVAASQGYHDWDVSDAAAGWHTFLAQVDVQGSPAYSRSPASMHLVEPRGLYDGGLGSPPSAQGWLYGTDPPTGAGAIRTLTPSSVVLDTTATTSDSAGYFSEDPLLGGLQHPNMPVLDRDAGYAVQFRARVEQEHHVSSNRAGFSVIVLSEDHLGIELGFWENEIWAQSGADFVHAEGVMFDTTQGLTEYELRVLDGAYSLWANGLEILNGALRDYSAHPHPAYSQSSFLFLGDNTTLAGARAELTAISVRGW